MTPATAAAMRAALETRITNQARDTGLDAGRLRRRLAFQRVLRRLAGDDRWVLKGGYLLEARLSATARATRDLDLACTDSGMDVVRDALSDRLLLDPDQDFFRFRVTKVLALGVDQAGAGGWRFSVDAELDGRCFDRIRIDVVERAGETAGGTECVELGVPVPGLPFTPATVVAVNVAQHAAEKVHALCRTYAGDRPSTRVKDPGLATTPNSPPAPPLPTTTRHMRWSAWYIAKP